LTQQAIAAAQVGDNAEAEELLRRATALDPENTESWLWLARTVRDLDEKREYFQRVLALDPYNERAKLGLERVQDKLGIAPAEVEAEEVMYCTWHPNVETGLRCNRCGRPMCPKCAVQHPVGLRCKECIRETRSPIYSPATRDYLIAGSVGLVLSTIAGLIMNAIGGIWFLALFIGPAIGAGIADLMFRTVRKRGKGMAILAGVCMVLGVMLGSVCSSLGMILAIAASSPSLLNIFNVFNFGTLIYLITGVAAAYARLR
jgi:hypothetical protein